MDNTTNNEHLAHPSKVVDSGVDGLVKRDEYHRVAGSLPNGMARTRCGLIMPAESS